MHNPYTYKQAQAHAHAAHKCIYRTVDSLEQIMEQEKNGNRLIGRKVHKTIETAEYTAVQSNTEHKTQLKIKTKAKSYIQQQQQ